MIFGSLAVCEYFLVLAPSGGGFDGDCDHGVWRFDGHGFGIGLIESYHFGPFESYLWVELRSADRCRPENQVAIAHWMATLVPVALVALSVFL